MDQSTIQIAAGVLFVVVVGIIIMRRKGKKGKASQEDEF